MSQEFIIGVMLLLAIATAAYGGFIRSSGNKIVFSGLMTIPQIILAIPIIFFVPLPNVKMWSVLFVSSCIHTIYIIFLAKAYEHGELSLINPLSRGLAVLISFLGAILLAGKATSASSNWGAVLIVIGAIGFAIPRHIISRSQFIKSCSYGTMAAFFIAGFAIVDTIGATMATNVLTYISWLFLIKGLLYLIPLTVFGSVQMTFLKKNWGKLLSAGILSGGSYAVTVWAFTHGVTHIILALRSTTVLFSLLIGRAWLKETVMPIKYLYGILIMLGIVFISVG